MNSTLRSVVPLAMFLLLYTTILLPTIITTTTGTLIIRGAKFATECLRMGLRHIEAAAVVVIAVSVFVIVANVFK